MSLSKTSGNLETDIKNALEKSMNGESSPEQYAKELSAKYGVGTLDIETGNFIPQE